MELYQLEAFEAVISHGSFTRAAEALYLTQPAVTRQIAALEAELQTRLFDRLGRTVHLTAAGEALHRYAEAIVRLVQEARHAIADIEAGSAGRLAVGASSTLATYVLPPLLRRFRESHPRVEISVHTGVSAQVLEMVRANEVDIGLVTSEVHDPALQATILADFATCVVVPPTHPLAARRSVSAAELAGSPLILMEAGTNLRAYVDRLLGAAGVEEQVTMELDNVEAIKRMIQADLGISLLPEVAVSLEVQDGRLVALDLTDVPHANRHITLTHRRDKYLTTAVQAFLHLLKTESG
ncbi:MAG TPA: LysR family transcriptional regulator [Chthonomonadaceae bacterium]|nr:LysR family transcriptional regulator [Chthonomonadaceae bacterium]